MFQRPFISSVPIFRQHPAAIAPMFGSNQYPNIRGMVQFFQTASGVIVSAEVTGLPFSTEKCTGSIFGFHIHEGPSCTGDANNPFSHVHEHYNPNHCPHPHHAGDLPPLFGNHGIAYSVFLTDRFSVREILGSTIIVHSAPDDFTTQPSGNSGEKIACGEIRPVEPVYFE